LGDCFYELSSTVQVDSFTKFYSGTNGEFNRKTQIKNNLNGKLDLNKLYGKVPYFKKLNSASKRSSRQPSRARGTTPKPPEDINDTIEKPKIEYGRIIGEGFLKTLMSIKKASLTYSSGYGMLLPGFSPEPDLLGVNLSTSAPGLGFVFGDQHDIRQDAANNGWITRDTILNNPYMRKIYRITFL